jgi:hypothetical protein
MLTTRAVLSCIAGLALSACSTLQQEAQDAVLKTLPDRRDVDFDDLAAYPPAVICGTYSAYRAVGYGRRSSAFVYVGGRVIDPATDDDRAIFCSKHRDDALRERLGIGPWDDPATFLPQIYADLTDIEAALRAYLKDNWDVPPAALGELVPRYLATAPLDPWGHPYRYEPGLGGRVVRSFTLYTLGADNAPGGSGADADVGIQHLKYLDIIAAARR